MLQPFAQFQKFGQDNMEATVKALGAFSANAQTIATEVADYARKSFENSSAVAEKLVGASSFEKAMEVQTAFLKGAYDSLVSQSAKMGALYTALATETFKPYEGLIAKSMKA